MRESGRRSEHQKKGGRLNAYRPGTQVPRLRSEPETLERPPVGALAQLLERSLSNLADTLACYTHELPDALERHPLGTFLQPVIQVENLPFPRSEVLLQDAVDQFPHELVFGALLDVDAFLRREPLTEGCGVPIGAVDGGVQ